MKLKFKAVLLVIIIFMLLPGVALLKNIIPNTKAQTQSFFRILDESSGKIINVPDREFIIGAIACEMPLSFKDEALKAQAIAAYTHYSKLRLKAEGEYDFTADTESFFIYTDEKNMKIRFGNNCEEYRKRLSHICDEVFGKAITYDNELITASYFAISSGNTENSKDIWGGDLMYLTAVASPWDAFEQGFAEKNLFSFEKAKSILETNDFTPPESINEIFGEVNRSKSGAVLSVICCGKETSGAKIRSMFALRSQNFTIYLEKGKLAFLTKGYGHGVGMSQTGANFLAKQGANHEDILKWYYKGCSISQIE